MRSVIKLSIIISIYMFSFSVHAAVLLDENNQPVNRERRTIADNGLSLRSVKKVGFGLGSAGALGLIGALIELNFSSEVSLSTSFGLASNYQTFGFQIKKILGGRSLMPYFSAGYSRWYTTGKGGPIGKTTPKFFAEKFLNAEERSSGRFAENLIYPGFGLQYVQLGGNWAGTSLYAEILLLVDVDDLQSAASGGLGMLFYF